MDKATIALELTKAIIIARPAVIDGDHAAKAVTLLEEIFKTLPNGILKDPAKPGDAGAGKHVAARRANR